MSPVLFLIVHLLSRPAPTGHQGQLSAEFALQRRRIAAACAPKPSSLMTCPIELFTDHPVHLAAGSLAPQNGFAFGPAFVTHRVSDARDLSLNADAVRSPGGSWRAGVYFKAVLTPVAETVVVPIDPGAAEPPAGLAIHPYPIVDGYVQTTSLRTVFFYGLGPDTTKEDRAAFATHQTVAGARVTYPLFRGRVFKALKLAAMAEVNGRWVDVNDPDGSENVPTVSARHTELTAPGISSQPGFAQFGEGVRIRPALASDRLRFNYAFSLAQFVAVSDSQYSFHRWTANLDQEWSLYRTVLAAASRDTHGPDDCSATLGSSPCPQPSVSRNRYGSIGFQVYASAASAGSSGSVPFYFQQTLGGSDIDGNRRLSAYEDYRFTGPKLFLMRESLEHYIYGIVGLSLTAEQGTVAAPGAALKLTQLKHSTAAGISVRAGGLPVAYLTWATGPEGHRFIATVNASLLGGSSRPSLK